MIHAQERVRAKRKTTCALTVAHLYARWIKEQGIFAKEEVAINLVKEPEERARVPTDNSFLPGSRDEVG